MQIETNEHYEPLRRVLQEAHDQAANGKGAERHADGQPFVEQPIFAISGLPGVGEGFMAGQAIKKVNEAMGMEHRGQAVAAKRELLGAIVYLAALVIYLEKLDEKV